MIRYFLIDKRLDFTAMPWLWVELSSLYFWLDSFYSTSSTSLTNSRHREDVFWHGLPHCPWYVKCCKLMWCTIWFISIRSSLFFPWWPSLFHEVANCVIRWSTPIFRSCWCISLTCPCSWKAAKTELWTIWSRRISKWHCVFRPVATSEFASGGKFLTSNQLPPTKKTFLDWHNCRHLSQEAITSDAWSGLSNAAGPVRHYHFATYIDRCRNHSSRGISSFHIWRHVTWPFSSHRSPQPFLQSSPFSTSCASCSVSGDPTSS